MATATAHRGEGSHTVGIRSARYFYYKSVLTKSKSNLRNFNTYLAATDDIVVHENGQENDYGALIKKGLVEEQRSHSGHFVSSYKCNIFFIL